MKILALVALASLVAADLSVVDHARQKVYTMEIALWKNISSPAWLETVANGLGGDIELARAFTRLNNELDALPKPAPVPLQTWSWTKVAGKLLVIEDIYSNFATFMKRQTPNGIVPSPTNEWFDKIDAVLTNPTGSINQTVKALHELLGHGDIFRNALLEGNSALCDLQLSPHQLVYDMYNTVALAEIKGYAMMQFSWMLLRVYDSGNFTKEASLTRDAYSRRSAKTATAAREALAMSSRDIYRCDPPKHTLGETYAEVTRLLQGYIENEVDLNKENTCQHNCAYYSLAERTGCRFQETYCSHQRPCNGKIVNCAFVDSDMWVCPAKRDSNRRYDWITYENGRTLGREGACYTGTTKVDSWWRWLFWHCSYCMCLCDEQGFNSDRYFSLRDAAAHLENNKVVTGLRLIKLGRVFHLQVAQGTLGERGQVTPGEWLAVTEFDPADPDVQEGVDFHTLTYERRAIDLDELDSPNGHVLTGIRFRTIGAHLHFEIRSTPFNYSSGRLVPERSEWRSNDNTDVSDDKPRTRLELVKPDLPTRTLSSLQVDSKHDQYLEFTHSDFDADAAQSTVPFVDIQPIYPLEGKSLISGAGVIHRGARGNGGFIAVKAFTYDYSKHIKAEAPDTLPDKLDDVDLNVTVN